MWFAVREMKPRAIAVPLYGTAQYKAHVITKQAFQCAQPHFRTFEVRNEIILVCF